MSISKRNTVIQSFVASACVALVSHTASAQPAPTTPHDAALCITCHGAHGKGNGARFPSIAGQPAQFVTDRLHEFQARARAKAPQPGTMTAVAATLDESQIQASAAYLSRLETGR